MIICDTSGLVAAYGADQAHQNQVLKVLGGNTQPLILSPFVLAELDYLVLSRAGTVSELNVLSDVAAGVYRLADFGPRDVARAAAVAERYRDLKIGLADASIVVLAERYETTNLLTLDQRHFRAVAPLQGGSFTILPADA
jgi:hypothetical protein